MSDTTDPTPHDPVDPDQPEPDDDQTFDASYVRRLRSEAASLRQDARVERERADQLDAQVQTLRSAAEQRTIQDAAAGRLRDPALLPKLIDVDACRTDDGHLDPDALTAAVDSLVDGSPYLKPAGPDFEGGARKPPTVATTAGQTLARVMREDR